MLGILTNPYCTVLYCTVPYCTVLYLPGLYDSVKEELRSTLGVSGSDTGAMLGVRVST